MTGDGSGKREIGRVFPQQMAGVCGRNVGAIVCGDWVFVWEHIARDKEQFELQSEADC